MIDSTQLDRSTQVDCDEELVARIASRDERGLTDAIELYAGQVKSICLRICVDELEADGVVSAVFWELWNGIAKYDNRRGTLRTYLLTLARSRAIDRQRAAATRARNCQKFFESHRPHFSGNTIMNEGTNSQEIKERGDELRLAIARLPEQQKSALELAFYDGLTHREVAARQSLPLGTIKTNIRRGLLQLRKLLAEVTNQERGLA